MVSATARLARVRDGLTPREWTRAGAMVLTVVGLNVAGWGMLAAAAGGHYHITNTQIFGFGTGTLAYTLGMRHAFDADHIAAIDNTTRKLVNDGKRPLSVGFFFSLGHSSIVFIMALLLNLGIRALDNQVRNGNSGLHNVTGIVGTGVSGTFLYLIAFLNVIILAGIVRVLREMRAGQYDDAELEAQLDKRGLMNRFLGPIARRADAPWKMYPIGMLFGLGFDTATEVALLVLAGSAVVSGLPFYAILSLPILFAAGMCLFDTIDGCFMNFAYDWAFAKPIRKVYYNLTITGLSVFVAMFIGTVEILGLISSEYQLSGGFWTFMGGFDINKAGYVIVGIFVLTWIAALGIWHFGKIEQKWDARQVRAGGAGGEQPEPIRRHELEMTAQTNLPCCSPSIAWSAEYQAHCWLTASTSSRPRPFSASPWVLMRTGGSGLASQTSTAIRIRSESTHSRIAACAIARAAFTAFVTNSETTSSVLSARLARPHSWATYLACSRADGTAPSSAPSSRKVLTGHRPVSLRSWAAAVERAVVTVRAYPAALGAKCAEAAVGALRKVLEAW